MVVSWASLGGHFRAYKWPIDVVSAAPLLKPALRDLVGNPVPARK
jgi:hypothetical protein